MKKKEVPDKNEIIIEEKKEESKEQNEIKTEKPKEEIPEKNEIIIGTSKKKSQDDFKKFIDKYPKNLDKTFEFNFFGDTLKPECVFFRDGRRFYVYFNLNELKNKLNEKWSLIFENYPKNLDDLKQPLEVFKSSFRKSKYK